ncbi:unnamed protein product [Rhodiola kirilowii]
MIKLDMSKAYDRLSWRFLLQVMRAFGFSHQWCDLIYRNISNCWYFIIWGGTSFDCFKSSRGVHQGDPLSPSLFILAMEYFSRLYNTSVQNSTIKSYIVASIIPPMHHLLYADDLLLFSSGRKDSVRKLLDIIKYFCAMSGQMLNPDKSVPFFAKSISDCRRKDLLKLTSFKNGTFQTNYLGAPLFPGRPKIIFFKHLEDNIRNKIEGWTKQFLSISGRATLISSVLGSLSVHTLSILPVPKGCIKKMESLMSNFLWDSKRHWIKWSAVCTPKMEGGLGIRNLSGVKNAVLAKLAWKFLIKDSLWANYATQRFLSRSSSSATWRAIHPLVKDLRNDSVWAIGSGNTYISHLCEWLDITVIALEYMHFRQSLRLLFRPFLYDFTCYLMLCGSFQAYFRDLAENTSEQ